MISLGIATAPRRFAVALSLLALVLAAGCGDDATSPGDAGPTTDAGTDAAVVVMDSGPLIPDGATLCTDDSQCDDGVACTHDTCSPLGYCRHGSDPAMCDDGIFCDGVEKCDPLRGCMPGPPETCNDHDVCTIDTCDEASKTCLHGPRDFDGDGEADWHCPGGTDCNDFDPRIGSTVAEVCGDNVDNDCDGMIDEADCGAPPHDTCADPLDVSAGGVFTLPFDGAAPDYSSSCGSAGAKDEVLVLTLTEAHSVRIAASGPDLTALTLRTTCDDRTTETSCGSGFPARVRLRSLDPGTYFVIVSLAAASGSVDVTVDLSDPVPPPTNETCASPIDVSAGGTFTGSMAGVSDDITTTCGFSGWPDLLYTFTTTDAQDVSISAVSDTGDSMGVAVESTCGDETSELRCMTGSPAGTTLHELPAGTYFIVLEGPSYSPVDFTLDVEMGPPTPPPPGDLCSSAIPLTLGTPTLGTLADKQDDIDTSCGYHYRDAVYSFALTTASDITVDVDGGTAFMDASIRPTCADGTSELQCTSGLPSHTLLRDLAAGTYYVVVESASAAGFNIVVNASTATPVTPVTGNDGCSSPYVMPASGGLFSGNTTGYLNDLGASCGGGATSPDVIFELDLSAREHVVASTAGSAFDTVLHVSSGMCGGMGTEIACNDDDTTAPVTTSLLDLTLDPGSYFFYVDGFGSSSAGAYIFDVTVTAP